MAHVCNPSTEGCCEICWIIFEYLFTSILPYWCDFCLLLREITLGPWAPPVWAFFPLSCCCSLGWPWTHGALWVLGLMAGERPRAAALCPRVFLCPASLAAHSFKNNFSTFLWGPHCSCLHTLRFLLLSNTLVYVSSGPFAMENLLLAPDCKTHVFSLNLQVCCARFQQPYVHCGSGWGHSSLL